MKLFLDDAVCAGYGVCESVNDELFEVDAQGMGRLLMTDVSGDALQDAQHAIDSCPTGALSLEA